MGNISLLLCKLQSIVARITTTATCRATNFSAASCSNMLHEVELGSTLATNLDFCCSFYQLRRNSQRNQVGENDSDWLRRKHGGLHCR